MKGIESKFKDKDSRRRLHISQLARKGTFSSICPLFVFPSTIPCPPRFEYRNVLKLFPLRETACRYHRTYATGTTVYVITAARILRNYFTGNTMIRGNKKEEISFRCRNCRKKGCFRRRAREVIIAYCNCTNVSVENIYECLNNRDNKNILFVIFEKETLLPDFL